MMYLMLMQFSYPFAEMHFQEKVTKIQNMQEKKDRNKKNKCKNSIIHNDKMNTVANVQ